MKFLLVSGILPPDIGGPARVISDLAETLRSQGHEVGMMAYGAKDDMSDGIIRIRRSQNIFSRYWALTQAIRQKSAPDVIILATDVFSVGIPTRLALIGKTNQFILRLGGEWAWEDAVTKGRFFGTLRQYWKTSHGLRGVFEKINYRWILNRADKICVSSFFLRDALSLHLGMDPKKFSLTPNESQLEVIPRTRPIPHQPLRLLYIGRFAPVKNIPFLAQVLVDILKEGLVFEADIIGEGSDQKKIERIIVDQRNIRLHPPQEKSQLTETYNSHDILLLPSLSDICPNGVLEALSAGLPCLITKEHGLSRSLGGIMELDPMEPEVWKHYIRQCIKEPERVRALAAAISIPPRRPDEQTLSEILTASVQVR